MNNIITKTDFYTYCDVGSLKIQAKEFTALNPLVWYKEESQMIPNLYGDGETKAILVKVRDLSLPFSRHKEFGDEPPILMAEAQGTIKIFDYDCGEQSFEIFATDKIQIYAKNNKIYLVGTNFQCPKFKIY